ncbi:NAD kinase 2 [Euphorbia peplus]|nr:NAD kinase 2 [Euphorbia peplus]
MHDLTDVFGSYCQILQSHDPLQLPWMGPVPGDVAEVEAYCRIFRTAERLHAALMDTLCNPVTGECTVSYDFTPKYSLQYFLVSYKSINFWIKKNC